MGKKEQDNKELELIEKATKLKTAMHDALINDYSANKNKKPALERLKILDEIYKSSTFKPMQETLLDIGILNEIKLWLEPLPDNSLPNTKIKTTMLEILNILPIKRNHLINSDGVGKIVNFYSKNSKESGDIRSLADALVKKWTYLFVMRDEEDDI